MSKYVIRMVGNFRKHIQCAYESKSRKKICQTHKIVSKLCSWGKTANMQIFVWTILLFAAVNEQEWLLVEKKTHRQKERMCNFSSLSEFNVNILGIYAGEIHSKSEFVA